MRIAFLGNYPPKSCGIGTFTDSLTRAVLANLPEAPLTAWAAVIAMESPADGHAYPPVVTRTIAPQEPGSYHTAADYLNKGDFELLVIQHEYGIYGGDDGVHLLGLLDRLELPVVTTLHTVLKQPSQGQRTVLNQIARRSQVIVVMTRMAANLLRDIYAIPEDKIAVIEHGVPVIDTAPRGELREQLGWSERKVIFTFGLLGRGKGIETAIRALPAIVARHPDTLYVVLGKTHPNVLRENGEEYRHYLLQLAAELGVAENVQLIAEFASEQRLYEHLRACDLYVLPYPNQAQISSGTLAYAMGAGATIVSTPFWHASELLVEERGVFFPFQDSDRLAAICTELLADPQRAQTLRRNAGAYGRRLHWTHIGAMYLEAFHRAIALFAKQPLRAEMSLPLPEIDLSHLFRLTDQVGIIQHAKYATPNRHEGYCLDDNGRALLLVSMLLQRGIGDRRRLERLAERYLSYIYHAQRADDGSFHNFMGFDRRFIEEHGSEDSFGRALWGVAYSLAHPPREDMRDLLREIFVRAIDYTDRITSPRTIAACVLATTYFLDQEPSNESMLSRLEKLAHKLCDHFDDTQCAGWEWFEAYLTYDNALLPLALLRAQRYLEEKRISEVAEQSTDFLVRQTVRNGAVRPVGCAHPFSYQGAPSPYDQQPVNVLAKVLLFDELCRQRGRKKDFRHLFLAFEWFLGKNDLNLPLYNPETGGCYDGLMATGINQNQGAESLLAYLISRVVVEDHLALRQPGAKRKPRSTRLKKKPARAHRSELPLAEGSIRPAKTKVP